jgi:hypothetical protein
VQRGDRFSIGLRVPSDQSFGEEIHGTVPEEVTSSSRFMIFNVFPSLRVTEAGLYKLGIAINNGFENQEEVPFFIKAGQSRVVH